MKRFHLHVSVANLDESIRFYSTLFAEQPAVRQSDYAKWMLEDPSMNFAISTHRQPVGVNHLGFQVDSDEELRGMRAQLQAADSQLIQEDEQPCCYARSDKYWVTDPTGIAWETFHTLGSIPVYGKDTEVFNHGASPLPVSNESRTTAACCVPAEKTAQKATRADCCGGPAPGDLEACCMDDTVAKNEGQSDCGCGSAA
jgi:catechol 2,3-dioxygenase-like lactoylglutathione lyase family enzyme